MYLLESLSLLLLSMDKFVVREPKKDPHLAVNKSAKDRAAQYPGVFHADNGLLFCSTCNIVLDHSRKSVLDKQCPVFLVRSNAWLLSLKCFHELKNKIMSNLCVKSKEKLL